jgi:hypothetical protein
MLVTADDLQAAMNYPLSVVQVLLRSYFGCGIVCGLDVTDPNADKPSPENPECEPDHGFVIEIEPGVALGCDGYPIELCSKVKLNLSPDPCGCKLTAAETRFIAIRRERSAEPSRAAAGAAAAAAAAPAAAAASASNSARASATMY